MILAGIYLGLFLAPLIAGVIVALILTKPRSDLLALFISLVLLFLFQRVLKASYPITLLDFNYSEMNVPLVVFSSICSALIIPYILCRWGIDLADLFRTRKEGLARKKTKGNTVLLSFLLLSVILMFTQ